MALYYKDKADKLVDEREIKKIDQVPYYYGEMCSVCEAYIDHYKPEEAESDEYKVASSLVAWSYEDGVGVPKDLDKAREYRYRAETFDEQTKTSREPSNEITITEIEKQKDFSQHYAQESKEKGSHMPEEEKEDCVKEKKDSFAQKQEFGDNEGFKGNKDLIIIVAAVFLMFVAALFWESLCIE